MKGSRLARAAVFGVAAWLIGTSAQATPLFDFARANTSIAPDRQTYGYAFTVSGGDVAFDGLGMFSAGGGRLDSSHEVALWHSDRREIISVILNHGTSPDGSDSSISGAGDYIYKNVALVLAPGTYVLGASFHSTPANKDPVAFLAAPIVSNSGNVSVLSFQGREGNSTGINAAFPEFLSGNDRWFGPALRIAAAEIPEPLTLSLLVVGMAGIGLGLRNNGSRRTSPSQTPGGTLAA